MGYTLPRISREAEDDERNRRRRPGEKLPRMPMGCAEYRRDCPVVPDARSATPAPIQKSIDNDGIGMNKALEAAGITVTVVNEGYGDFDQIQVCIDGREIERTVAEDDPELDCHDRATAIAAICARVRKKTLEGVARDLVPSILVEWPRAGRIVDYLKARIADVLDD